MRHAGGVGWFLSSLILMLLSTSGPAQAGTAGDFSERLDKAIRQVEAAQDRGTPLGDASALFPESEEVTGPEGEMRLDHTSLRTEWNSVAPEGNARKESLERLRHRLTAVRAEATRTWNAAAEGAPQSLGWREKLTEVLSLPEFRKGQSGEDWRSRFMQWLLDKLAFVFPRGATQAVGSVLRWMIYGLAGAALVAVLFVLVRVALPLFACRGGGVRAPTPSAPMPAETQQTLLALADQRARSGDLRGAAQAVYRWMLLGLQRTGRLDYDPALTNREHLRRLTADTSVRVAFEHVSSRFELVWYGFHPLAAEEFAAFRAECQRVAGGRT